MRDEAGAGCAPAGGATSSATRAALRDRARRDGRSDACRRSRRAHRAPQPALDSSTAPTCVRWRRPRCRAISRNPLAAFAPSCTRPRGGRPRRAAHHRRRGRRAGVARGVDDRTARSARATAVTVAFCRRRVSNVSFLVRTSNWSRRVCARTRRAPRSCPAARGGDRRRAAGLRRCRLAPAGRNQRTSMLEALRGGLIVSVQAEAGSRSTRPRRSRCLPGRGRQRRRRACGWKGSAQIAAVRRAIDVPVIGLVKRAYPGYEPYITASEREIAEAVAAGATIVAFDATARPRPDGRDVAGVVEAIHARGALAMADCATEADDRAGRRRGSGDRRDDAVRLHRIDARHAVAGAGSGARVRGRRRVRDLRGWRRFAGRRARGVRGRSGRGGRGDRAHQPRRARAPLRARSPAREVGGATRVTQERPGGRRPSERACPREKSAPSPRGIRHIVGSCRVSPKNPTVGVAASSTGYAVQRGSVGTARRQAEDQSRPGILARYGLHRRALGGHDLL